MTNSTVPYVFTVDEMLWHFLEVGPPTADDIETALVRVGRNAGPALVLDLFDNGLLTAAAARRGVPHAWCMCEWPGRAVDPPHRWRDLFDLAGYTVDSVPSKRPTTPLTLYRGAVPEHRDGWSWTDDIQLAQWFAERPHNAGRGRIWTAVVEPSRLLARIITEGRDGESEYVLDPSGLAVQLATR